MKKLIALTLSSIIIANSAFAVVQEQEPPVILDPPVTVEREAPPSSSSDNTGLIIGVIAIGIGMFIISRQKTDIPNNCPVITDQSYNSEKPIVDPYIIQEC